VSTSALARSSDWLPDDARRMVDVLVAQLARVSHEPTVEPRRTRTSMRIHVPAGVAALHDGTTVLMPNPGDTHGDVQVPYSYVTEPPDRYGSSHVVVGSLPERRSVPPLDAT
jgi:hypothetical protein